MPNNSTHPAGRGDSNTSVRFFKSWTIIARNSTRVLLDVDDILTGNKKASPFASVRNNE